MIDLNTTVANVAVVIIAAKEAYTYISNRVSQYRREHGSNLQPAFRNLGHIYESLHALYLKLKPEDGKEEENGFFSLRMYIAHNGGSPLSETMNWKCSSFSTYPSKHKKLDDWQNHPMDYEYISKVLEPTVIHGYKHTRAFDLDHNGPLGAMFQNRGIDQMVTFLIKAMDTEIIFAAVMFTSSKLTPAQIHELQETRSAIEAHIGRGSSPFFQSGAH